MEKLCLLKSESLEGLRNSILTNLDRYRTGNFSGILDTLQVDIEIDIPLLNSVKLPVGDDLKDVENCEIINDVFSGLSPFAARDERLWTYMCHGPLLEYARNRWPIPSEDEKAVAFIRSHFFAADKRNLEARNAVSRLFWLSFVASRVTDLPLNETLSLILHKQDIRQNIIERPTVLQANKIFTSVIHSLKKSLESDQSLFIRENFRSLQEKLNEYCGFMFVECLPMPAVQTIVDEMVNDILSKKSSTA